jgi:hypothetical protein
LNLPALVDEIAAAGARLDEAAAARRGSGRTTGGFRRRPGCSTDEPAVPLDS